MRFYLSSFTVFLFQSTCFLLPSPSFPTRRSSDLGAGTGGHADHLHADGFFQWFRTVEKNHRRDRKSTRLNSSHVSISYAVFCFKIKMLDHSAKNNTASPAFCRNNSHRDYVIPIPT